MLASKTRHLLRIVKPATRVNLCGQVAPSRFAVTSPSGAILPEPRRARFGYLNVIFCVTLGLSIGAFISKHIASFLEENELFVPTDDDDDDD